MKILEKTNDVNFPFDWADIDYYPDSKAQRKEIYLLDDDSSVEGLISLFYSLFGSVKNDLKIFDKSWWDFCLETWNINQNKSDYEISTKSGDCGLYLQVLKDAEIEHGYSGCCKCTNWDKYLALMLTCIVNNTAPYSPIFCDVNNKFFFYFHQSGSIGLYYKEENEFVKDMLSKANEEYEIVSYS